MPHVLPGMPNAAPETPQNAMQPQHAGQVPLGCASCQGALLWAKILIPVSLIGITTAIIVAATRRSRVQPYFEAIEETDF